MVMEWLRSASSAPPGIVRRVMPNRVMDHLIRDERVLVSTRHHPVVAVWPMPASLAILIGVAALTAQLPLGNPLIDLLWWGWFASVGYAGWKLLEWSNEIFVVTDRRVMLFTGFLTRHIAMMPIVKVTDLTYRRTLGGRLLRYGELVIESAGQDQALHTVKFLPNPSELYHDIAGTLFGRAVARTPEPSTRTPARSGRTSPAPTQPPPHDAVTGSSPGSAAGQLDRSGVRTGERPSPSGRTGDPGGLQRTASQPNQGEAGSPTTAERASATGPAERQDAGAGRPDLDDTATFDPVDD